MSRVDIYVALDLKLGRARLTVNQGHRAEGSWRRCEPVRCMRTTGSICLQNRMYSNPARGAVRTHARMALNYKENNQHADELRQKRRLQKHGACRQWERVCRQRVRTCGRQKERELCRGTTEEIGDLDCSTPCVLQFMPSETNISNVKPKQNVNRVH